ncbi:MAG TPA: ABC transporter permease [Bryobacteraceae bacterium]|nr:ABC transporter permease [Bryobacteraceae bacterium]
MARLRSFLSRLAGSFATSRLDRDLDQELRAHIEMETAENIRLGMTPEQARRTALVAFGGLTQTAENCRDHRALPFVETLARDWRYATRVAAKSPGFTAVAILSLALGIGASTSIFCVVDAVLLRPLPYRDSDRLVLVREQLSPIAPQPMPVPAPDARELIKGDLFERAGAMLNRRFDVSNGSTPERVNGARVSAATLQLLGIAPLHGRVFLEEEDRPGIHVVVLGYDLWQRLTGGDASIVGKTIQVDRQPYQVAGIMPRQFVFPPQGLKWEKPAELFVPLALTPDELRVHVDNSSFGVLGRLKPGITIEQADARMESVAREIQAAYPLEIQQQLPKNIRLHAMVLPLRDQVVGGSRKLLLILMAAVCFLLLIACANVANMLLSRAGARGPELALRLALGASRGSLIRQLLTENLLLSVASGILGIAFACAAIGATISLLPADLPRMAEISLDWRVLAFSVALCVATTLLFGLAPAIATTRVNLDRNLREGGRGSARLGRVFAGGLVIAEIALTVVLQAGASLLIRSLIQARDHDPGMRPAQVLSVSIALPGSVYRSPESVNTFYRDALREFAAMPGVMMAGAASSLPFSATQRHVYTVENHSHSPTNFSEVLGDYFQTLGIALRRGRWFNDNDRPDSERVVLINETAARQFWPGEDPVGKRVKWGVLQTPWPWMTVVGVVADVSQDAADKAIQPHIYEPFMQSDSNAMSLVVLAHAPENLANSVRAALRRMDPDLPISRLQTLEQAQRDSITPRRATTWIVSSFAAAALLLASIGVYGAMMFLVSQRRKEIAIRMVLGATRESVLTMVLGRGMALISSGLLIGLAASFALSRFIASLLYSVRPTDAWAYLITVGVLGMVALLAQLGPVRSATRVESADALRHD